MAFFTTQGSSSEYRKPVPVPTHESMPYWEGTRARELRVQHCGDCGLYQFYPPRAMCRRCMSENLSWVKTSGRATVYSTSVVYRAPSAEFALEAPYNVSLIELEEGGIRLISNVIGIDPEAVTIGMPVEVVFDDITSEVTLPRFRPVEAPLQG